MRRSGLLVLVALLAIVAGCGTATLLPDGRVLLMNIVVKAYDPATGRVGNLSTPATQRVYATATLLQDGRVLVAGGGGNLGSAVTINGSGTSESTTFASADLYDPVTDTYSPTGSMAQPRAFHTATLLADGRVLILGGGASESETAAEGTTPTPQQVPPPEIYDPATGTFGPAGGDTLIPRVFSTATLLPDGKVLIAGGVTIAPTADGASPDPDADGIPTAAAELFDPATGTFSAAGSMTAPRVWHTATALADGRVLLVGGTVNINVTESSQGTVDPTTLTAEVYDPASGTFSATGPLASPRMGHAASVLQDGRVIVTGGMDLDPATTETLARSAELFDPAAGAFSPTGDMASGHAFHTATTLADGRVLVVGFGEEVLSGMTSGTTPDLLSSAEIYDAAAGTFALVEVEPAVLPSPAPS